MSAIADAAAALDAGARARLAALCLAVEPALLGGAVLRAPRGDLAQAWLDALRALLPVGTPVRRIPLGIPDDRLHGGLDLALTLATGRPVAERGLLAAADGGVVVLPCAERADGALVARLAQVLDTQSVPSPMGEARQPARLAIVALDEGAEEEERPAGALVDRVAFLLALDADPLTPPADRAEVAAARALLPRVESSDAGIRACTGTAVALGIASLRAPTFALRTARVLAALDCRLRVTDDDLATAAVLVLGPRATRMPASAEQAPPDPPAPPDDPDASDRQADEATDESRLRELEEMLVRAVAATLPVGLVLDPAARPARGRANGGRAGNDRAGSARGRQVGTRRGDPRAGGRLDLIETLRAAAPWQRIRGAVAGSRARVQVRPDDFRLRRLHEPAGTTAIFVVDASGSAALHRMTEAKGAVELLLAESYARRDEVGLVAFRGTTAEVLLPPTRAIAAAKRALAALPGGGGTPLAGAIDRARELAMAARRAGNDTIVVFLTDARANIARDGTPGRPQAEADATASAQALRTLGGTVLLIDTSPRPAPQAQRLAEAMGARYVALPRTDAAGIHQAVRAALPERGA